MASPGRYRDALEQAGFTDIAVTSRNDWYRETARQETRAMKGPLHAKAVERLGQDFVDHNIDIWERRCSSSSTRASIARRICAAASPERPTDGDLSNNRSPAARPPRMSAASS